MIRGRHGGGYQRYFLVDTNFWPGAWPHLASLLAWPHLVSLDGLGPPGQEADEGALTRSGLYHAAAQAALNIERKRTRKWGNSLPLVFQSCIEMNALTGVLWRNS